MTKFYAFVLCFLLTSCAGYRFSQQDNPLSQYGIQSISIPSFYNYSTLPHVSAEFSREVFAMMMGFPSLKVTSGFDNSSDAVMIGIVKSSESLRETLRPQTLRVAQGSAPNAIGPNRKEFYIPGGTNVQLYLQLVVIKRPTEEELAIIHSSLGESVQGNDKVIFNEFIPVTGGFAREIFDNESVNVVGTQNKGAVQKSVKLMAEQAAQSVKEMILYAF